MKGCIFKDTYCSDYSACSATKLLEWMANYNSDEYQVARLASQINSMCERRK